MCIQTYMISKPSNCSKKYNNFFKHLFRVLLKKLLKMISCPELNIFKKKYTLLSFHQILTPCLSSSFWMSFTSICEVVLPSKKLIAAATPAP